MDPYSFFENGSCALKLLVMEFTVGLLVDLLDGCIHVLLWELNFMQNFLMDLPLLYLWEQWNSDKFSESKGSCGSGGIVTNFQKVKGVVEAF